MIHRTLPSTPCFTELPQTRHCDRELRRNPTATVPSRLGHGKACAERQLSATPVPTHEQAGDSEAHTVSTSEFLSNIELMEWIGPISSLSFSFPIPGSISPSVATESGLVTDEPQAKLQVRSELQVEPKSQLPKPANQLRLSESALVS